MENVDKAFRSVQNCALDTVTAKRWELLGQVSIPGPATDRVTIPKKVPGVLILRKLRKMVKCRDASLVLFDNLGRLQLAITSA